MSGPAALVQDLRHRGVLFRVRNERLVIDAPDDALTDQDIQSLRSNKVAIVALLTHEHAPCRGKLHCHSCRSRRFWRSTRGRVICAVCHPPAADHLIADWIDAGPPPSKGWLGLGNLSDEVVRARIARLRRLNADGSDPDFGE